MRYLLLLLSILIYTNVQSQNTKLIFNDSPIDKSDFDGEQIKCNDDRRSNVKSSEEIIPFVLFHDNGQVAEEGLIVNNRPEGVWKKYDKHGNLIGRIKYKEGSKSGKWIVRDQNGKLLAKGRYDNNGNKTGNWTYWSNTDQKYLKGSF